MKAARNEPPTTGSDRSGGYRSGDGRPDRTNKLWMLTGSMDY